MPKRNKSRRKAAMKKKSQVKVEKKVETKKKVSTPNYWMYTTFVFVALTIALSFLYSSGECLTGQIANSVPAEEAAQNAINYINTYLLRGVNATLNNVTEENGLYAMKVELNGRIYDSYVTKDGVLFFPSAINITETPEIPEEQQPTEFDAPDREKANIKFFVMSFCPFGNQAESGLEPVYRLLGEKVEWEPHYVIYSDYAKNRGANWQDYCLDEEEKYCSMHGIQELHQDIRELCVWKYYDHSTWWDFVKEVNAKCNSRDVDTCWESIAESVGIDVNKIKTCQENEAVELLQREVELNEQYGVRGSPTVFINDQEYRGARTPEAYKKAICSGFSTPPEECNQTLSSSGNPSNGGQC